MPLAQIVNYTLSTLTVAGQIIALILALLILFSKKNNQIKILDWVGTNAMLLSFCVALIAMLGSLTYSDILGYEPCKLCWYQRIFMYPEVFLLGLALFKKDKNILPYALMMAFFGELIALYHYVIQLGLLPAPCSISGYSVSCAKKFVLQFGYITIPLMAFTAFVLIILFTLIGSKSDRVK